MYILFSFYKSIFSKQLPNTISFWEHVRIIFALIIFALIFGNTILKTENWEHGQTGPKYLVFIYVVPYDNKYKIHNSSKIEIRSAQTEVQTSQYS